MRIHLYSIHGLFRGHNLEIGRDSDNGGQTVYVMELAKALSESPRVDQVHLFTRRIEDDDVSNDYGERVEVVNEKFDIRRIDCGGPDYLMKEELWPHLDEFVSNTIRHIKSEKIFPDYDVFGVINGWQPAEEEATLKFSSQLSR